MATLVYFRALHNTYRRNLKSPIKWKDNSYKNCAIFLGKQKIALVEYFYQCRFCKLIKKNWTNEKIGQIEANLSQSRLMLTSGKCSPCKIFAVSFKCYIRLVLKNSFTSFLQPAWIETDSVVIPSSAVGCVQLVPEYISKVKLDRWQSPNILSEKLIFLRMRPEGNILVNSPISTFQQG